MMTELFRGDMRPQESSGSTCPNCEELRVSTTDSWIQFPYGVGESAVTLEAVVPLHACAACEFEYLDGAAERIKHEAVCAHLGLLTPAQIEGIRRRHDLSRAEFCRITKIGEATLARWERGELLQNAAYDQYVRLLEEPKILARVRAGGAAEIAAPAAAPISTPSRHRARRFRSHVTSASYPQRSDFQVRSRG